MRVLITGGTSGIGKALSNRFLELGHEVIITTRDLKSFKHNFSNLKVFELEISSSESIEKFVKEINNVKIDILINCAGLGIYGPLIELTKDQMRRQFDVNVFGSLELVSKLSNNLGGGKIVNVSSISCEINLPFGGIYSASKSALNCVSEIMRMELMLLNINVITLRLGLVNTSFIKNAQRAIIKNESPYKKYESIINDRSDLKNKMSDPQKLAISIVNKLLKKSTSPIIYAGEGSIFYPLIKKILPLKMYQYLIMKKFKLI